MKLCNACQKTKHEGAFRKGEWVCKECRSRQRHTSRIMQEYGLTTEERDKLVQAQGGRCAICQREFEGEPYVDHDHATRKVRGLLCHHCNSGLGMFRDSSQLLLRAAKYVAENVARGA